jgi:hypothetical protein
MIVTVRPSKELVEYIKSRMLGCVISHMMVKSNLDVDKLLNSLVEYFYRIYGRRYSLSKEVFKEITNSVKQYIRNKHNSKNEVI